MTTPDHIGKYENLQLIGQGGFGNVYRAWDPDLRRQVALKVMHAQFAQDEQWVASFQQEARLMARVHQHPNVVRVIELQQDEQHGLFIAMDYYLRGNLKAIRAKCAERAAVARRSLSANGMTLSGSTWSRNLSMKAALAGAE